MSLMWDSGKGFSWEEGGNIHIKRFQRQLKVQLLTLKVLHSLTTILLKEHHSPNAATPLNQNRGKREESREQWEVYPLGSSCSRKPPSCRGEESHFSF